MGWLAQHWAPLHTMLTASGSGSPAQRLQVASTLPGQPSRQWVHAATVTHARAKPSPGQATSVLEQQNWMLQPLIIPKDAPAPSQCRGTTVGWAPSFSIGKESRGGDGGESYK